MKLQTCLTTALLSGVICFALSLPAAAADRLTYEEYQTQLKAYQDREAQALAALDEENKKTAELRARLAELNAQIAATWDEIYMLAGLTKEAYEDYLQRLGEVERQKDGLASLSPERLLDRSKEINELKSKSNALRGEPGGILSEPQRRLDRLDAELDRLAQSLPKPAHDSYNVVRGDHLWGIAGKPAIYGDSWKWMRIYSANRTEIRNPDLIYPKQMLRIPRQIGRDQHLVGRGQTLAKIAGLPEVYGDPFQWTKIYQANKDGGFIKDPNLIYPEQILTIPQN